MEERREGGEEGEREAGGSSFLTAEGDDGSPAGQCETQRVDPTQLARSQDGSGDLLTLCVAGERRESCCTAGFVQKEAAAAAMGAVRALS